MSPQKHIYRSSFLCRAGLVGAVLALIAGIFGMHVMTTGHAHHAPTVEAVAGAAHHPTPGHGCPESDNCFSSQAMTGGCTPSVNSVTLAAPLPGSWISTRSGFVETLSSTSPITAVLALGPSPGDLGISRT